jgi:hypothetical protein
MSAAAVATKTPAATAMAGAKANNNQLKAACCRGHAAPKLLLPSCHCHCQAAHHRRAATAAAALLLLPPRCCRASQSAATNSEVMLPPSCCLRCRAAAATAAAVPPHCPPLPRFCHCRLAATANATLPSTTPPPLFKSSLLLLSSLPFPSLLPPLLLVDYCAD